MKTQEISAGVVHELPENLRLALLADADTLKAWEDITPLARNEWICWITSPKKQETRDYHLKRIMNELKGGKRRPCCWAGCIHRVKNKQ